MVGAGDEHALLMVRFVHGPTAPFSLRRPIDDVIIGGLDTPRRVFVRLRLCTPGYAGRNNDHGQFS